MFFILNSSIAQSLSNLDLLACLLASVCHDVAHPGFTNKFIIATYDHLALVYNDQSVLENMHASTCFI